MFIAPAHRWNPDPVKADVVSQVISGGTSISGEEDVIATDGGGRWEGTWGNIALDGPKEVNRFRAWVAHWAGGAQSFLWPILSLDGAPRPIGGNGYLTPSDIIVDDEDFPTSVGFASPHIVAETVGDAALRATTITILITQGEQISVGQAFGVGYRAYRIERITARDGMEATCKITPPLREAIDDGTAVNFDWPVVECRIAPGQDLSPEVVQGRYADVSVRFVEHVTYGE